VGQPWASAVRHLHRHSLSQVPRRALADAGLAQARGITLETTAAAQLFKAVLPDLLANGLALTAQGQPAAPGATLCTVAPCAGGPQATLSRRRPQ